MYNLEPKTRKEHLMGKIAGNPNAEEITDLKTREEHFLKDIEEASGGGSEPFIVTLTPTAADFSGTMDKTVGEINEAWLRGKRIVLKALVNTNGAYSYADCTEQTVYPEKLPYFNAFIIQDAHDRLVFAVVGGGSDPDKTSYSTKIYTLTPAT